MDTYWLLGKAGFDKPLPEPPSLEKTSGVLFFPKNMQTKTRMDDTGSLGGMRNTLLSALRAIPVCRAAAHILAARMQKAVILGVPSSA
nr:unnamed protein product [Callosobruchus chinensis]